MSLGGAPFSTDRVQFVFILKPTQGENLTATPATAPVPNPPNASTTASSAATAAASAAAYADQPPPHLPKPETVEILISGPSLRGGLGYACRPEPSYTIGGGKTATAVPATYAPAQLVENVAKPL